MATRDMGNANFGSKFSRCVLSNDNRYDVAYVIIEVAITTVEVPLGLAKLKSRDASSFAGILANF